MITYTCKCVYRTKKSKKINDMIHMNTVHTVNNKIILYYEHCNGTIYDHYSAHVNAEFSLYRAHNIDIKYYIHIPVNQT